MCVHVRSSIIYLFVNCFPLWFVQWSPLATGSWPVGVHQTSARNTTAVGLQRDTHILRGWVGGEGKQWGVLTLSLSLPSLSPSLSSSLLPPFDLRLTISKQQIATALKKTNMAKYINGEWEYTISIYVVKGELETWVWLAGLIQTYTSHSSVQVWASPLTVIPNIGLPGSQSKNVQSHHCHWGNS